jgi:hypothetical protein
LLMATTMGTSAACVNAAQHAITQHSTAQHSTAQHRVLVTNDQLVYLVVEYHDGHLSSLTRCTTRGSGVGWGGGGRGGGGVQHST